ncbi:hypothetical protein D9756_000849 [Leucocoprinus leucothites]|uniref:Uncharacterized protein n=1 Tax=Leucocoprinus leucothites TaxID=201217 RepID=A0A8H5GEP0_9AGAR|nr:hypothetical protein D9756_000849 [Leucoagaricus leucothites]
MSLQLQPPKPMPAESSSTLVGLHCYQFSQPSKANQPSNSQTPEYAPAVTTPAQLSLTSPHPTLSIISSVPTQPTAANPNRTDSFPAPFNPPSITL